MTGKLGPVLSRCTLVIALGGASVLSGCAGGGEASGGDKIVIGVDLELSGVASFLGAPIKQGVDAAVEYVNAHGGVAGKKITVQVADNGSDPTKAVSSVRQLKEAGADIILGPSFAQDCVAVAPELARENVVGFCLSAVDLPAQSSNMFGIGIGYTTTETSIADQFAAMGYQRVGLLAANDTGGDQTVAIFVPAATRHGITVDVQRFDPTDTDLTSHLLALGREHPDAIRLQATGSEALVGIGNVRTLGITAPVWLPNSNASYRFAQQAKGDVGRGNVLTWIPALLSPDGAKQFPQQAPEITALKSVLPNTDTITAAGWDAIRVIADTFARVKGSGTDDLIKAAESGPMHFGAYSVQKITPEDHRGAVAQGTLLPAAFTTDGTFSLRKVP